MAEKDDDDTGHRLAAKIKQAIEKHHSWPSDVITGFELFHEIVDIIDAEMTDRD